MRSFTLFLATLLLSIPLVWADELAVIPSRIHARYLISKGGLVVAEIDEIFTRKNDKYSLTSIAKPLGLLAFFRPEKIFIRSHGVIDAQGLKPTQFSYQQEGNIHKNNHADFAWDKQKLSLNHDTQQTLVDLPDGTQDRLSALYQFMFLNLNAVHTLEFSMTNGSKVDGYHYLISEGDSLTTGAGKYTTWYLDSQAKKGETRTQIWLAAEQYNLPCKLVITDPEGGKLSQELHSLDIQP